jgi:adenylosuccinate synthase
VSNTVVLGMQWGDEGKGKIVDLICPAFDAVVRYQGGHNAGHTVKFADRHFALNFLPSGILHEGRTCVLGGGMVIEPDAFFAEVAKVEAAGVSTKGRLFVSKNAHLILPGHVALDRAREAARGDGAIGTTKKGIGPAYETKIARLGLRLGDLAARDLPARLRAVSGHLAAHLAFSEGAEGQPASAEAAERELQELEQRCLFWAQRFEGIAVDTVTLLNDLIDGGQSVLFEGAQGAMLDVDHGSFPFVTSSNTTAGGVCTGTGVPPTALDGVLGVVKAYSTRVGGGPFVTELTDHRGEHLRKRGNEFGTVTGRARRCGYFDAMVARYAARVNGVDALALTKIDVLDELPEIPICVGYRWRGSVLAELPFELDVLQEVEPIYKTMKGWQRSTVGAKTWEELPQEARDYVSAIEEEVGAPVGLLSTGPRREETILLDIPELDWLLGPRLEAIKARL